MPRQRTWWATLVLAFVLIGAVAPQAGAVLVHANGKGNDRHVFGVLPIRGIRPASIPGSFARHSTASTGGTASPSDNGTLTYQGGSVLRAESPYLIFWDPGNQITSGEKANLEQYFADTAAANGASSNIFAVDRQFTDTTGFADYKQTWSAGQAITDAQAFPALSAQCSPNHGTGYTETACIYDSQIQTEVQRLVSADSLPTGVAGSAPIYFVVTPPTVNTCFSDNSTCADNVYCAYHGSFTSSGSGHPDVLYANMPMLLAANDPKACQFDGNTAVQQPEGNVISDVVTSSMSHEFSETITDPVNGGGWYDTISGNEDGDNCSFTGSQNPAGGFSPDAFGPTLGGSASAGTLFDQLINSHGYYTQTEWSNGNIFCEAQPVASTLSPAFTAPAKAVPGQAVAFDPSASTSSAGYSSTTWSFGDGSSAFSRSAPAGQSHSFSALGTDIVALKTVDTFGNLATVSHTIDITNAAAAFTFSPSIPTTASAVQFDGSGSAITGSPPSYAWSADDGWSASGVTPATHVFTTPGGHSVTLTISNGTYSDSITHTVKIDAPPNASFAVTTSHPTATFPVAFDGLSSNESGGSIQSFSWSFGDGGTGSGPTPSHTYATGGTYTGTLTVTDQDGHTATTSQQVNIGSPPSASFTTSPAGPVASSPVSFDAASSNEPGGSISSYGWDFGDGSTGSGVASSHSYASGGTYTVQLTVTDANGYTASASELLTVAVKPAVAPAPGPASVKGLPTAAIAINSAHPVAGLALTFRGSASMDQGSSLVSYTWAFGDGASGAGVTRRHTYRRPGLYSVTLTVRDATGSMAAMTRTVRVTSAAITGVRVKKGKRVERLIVSLSGPGVLRLGTRRNKVKRPGKALIKYTLSVTQLQKLGRRHSLAVSLKLRYAPMFGIASSRTARFRLKA